MDSIRSTPARDLSDVSPEASPSKPHETRSPDYVNISSDKNHPSKPEQFYTIQGHYKLGDDKRISESFEEANETLAAAQKCLQKVRISAPNLESRLGNLRIAYEKRRSQIEESLLIADDIEVRKKLIDQLREVTHLQEVLVEAMTKMADVMIQLDDREKAQFDLLDHQKCFKNKLQIIEEANSRKREAISKSSLSMPGTSNGETLKPKPKSDDAPVRVTERKKPDGSETTTVKTNLLTVPRPAPVHITEDQKKLLGAIPKTTVRRK